MKLVRRPAVEADIPGLSEVFLNSFTYDPISILVFPRSEGSRETMDHFMSADFADKFCDIQVIYDADEEPKADDPYRGIVAFSKWKIPGSPPADENLVFPFPEGADAELGEFFFRTLFRTRNINMNRGDPPYWYLELIGTRLDYQGKGAGSLLLKYGLGKADEEGCEAYLEASPHGRPIYEKYGFKEVGRLEVDLRGKGLTRESLRGEDPDTMFEVYMKRPRVGERKD